MAEKPQPLEVGSLAPDFEVTTHSGDRVSLAALRGSHVALYFYPKDNTPGCTAQACNLEEHLGALADAGVKVIGVSPDDDASHAGFAEQHQLSFPLIADPEHEIISAYGVWGEKSNYGKTYMGLARTTFLIDPEGKIVHVFKRPKTKAHAEEILSKL